MTPVSPRRVALAALHIRNAVAAAVACRRAGVPYYVACALSEMESGGRNVWGGDVNGVNSDLHNTGVTYLDFMNFLVRVMNGETSNGVGPAQITYAGQRVGGHRDGGYFRQMLAEGLDPVKPADNLTFGLGRLAAAKTSARSWGVAYTFYNGGTEPNQTAIARGMRFDTLIQKWKKRFGV